MYSLVNAPTVAFDLARMPTGASVATVLLEALAIQTAPGTEGPDLSAFDPADATDVRRAAAWLEVSALSGRPPLGDAMSAARQFVDEALNGVDLSTAAGRSTLEPMVRDLSTGSFGGLDDLLRLLRLEILDESPTHVVALASDAIAAAYGGRRLADDVRTQLGAPWIAAVRSLPAIPADLGPFAREVRTVLDRVVTLTETEIAVVLTASAAAGSDWSRRMHAAAWAAYLSGRLRPAATAQFQAVRALRALGMERADVAARSGLWNAVSGCVQAVTLHDLLDEVTYGVLVAPWESAVGILS